MTHHPRPKPPTLVYRIHAKAAPAATYFLECMDGRSQHIANVLAGAEGLPPFGMMRVRYKPAEYDRLIALNKFVEEALAGLEMIRAAHGVVKR